MNFLKRALYSLRHYWLRTLLTTLMFTVLFAACVGSLVLYQTSRSQLQFMKETVEYSVTLKPVDIWDRALNAGIGDVLDPEQIEAFADSPYLCGYNYADYYMGELQGVKLLYPEEREKYKNFLWDFDIWLYCPQKSKVDRAFTMGGYQLVEGRHFTEEESHVCLVSKEFAGYNGFAVGDHITFVDCFKKRNEEPQDLEIVGLFTGPDSEYVKGIGLTPEEMVMAPARFVRETYGRSTTGWVQGFCKSREDLDAFVEELEEKFTIKQVIEEPMNVPSFIPPPEEFGSATFYEMAELLEENPMYALEYEHQLYDMVASPIEKMNALAGAMTAAFLAAAALVLVLSNTIFLKGKRREFGMLCAMGESKGKIVLQAGVEMLVPVLAAMVLGLVLGVSVGVPLAENLGGGVYAQNAENIQGQNDLISYAHRGQDGYSRDRLYNAASVDLIGARTHSVATPPKSEAVVDADTLTGYFSIVLVLAVLALVIQAGSVLRLKPAKILMRKG